jgi:hypothetical protein
MTFAIDHVDMYTLIAVGMGIGLLAAVVRQDGPSAMAMGFTALITGHLARLPVEMLIPGSALLMVALIVAPSVNLMSRLNGQTTSFRSGAVLTGAIVTLSATPAAAAAGLPDWNALLDMGEALHLSIDGLIT